MVKLPEALMIVVDKFMKVDMDIIQVLEGSAVDQIC